VESVVVGGLTPDEEYLFNVVSVTAQSQSQTAVSRCKTKSQPGFPEIAFISGFIVGSAVFVVTVALIIRYVILRYVKN